MSADRFGFLEWGGAPPVAPSAPTSSSPALPGGSLRAVEIVGEPGNGAGKFAAPGCLATDNDGSLYVVDANHHCVQRIALNGNVQVFGRPGRDAGSLWVPQGIAVHPSGAYFFVAEHGNDRVQCFAKSGASKGIMAGISGPTGIALDASGCLWICESGKRRLISVDTRSGLTTAATGDAARLASPTNVACDSGGNLYVTDTPAGDIICFDRAGKRTCAVSDYRRLASPMQCAVDRLGRIYAAEAGANRLHVLEPGGISIATFNNEGPSHISLDGPCGVAVTSDGGVYVSDTLHHRVLRLEW